MCPRLSGDQGFGECGGNCVYVTNTPTTKTITVTNWDVGDATPCAGPPYNQRLNSLTGTLKYNVSFAIPVCQIGYSTRPSDIVPGGQWVPADSFDWEGKYCVEQDSQHCETLVLWEGSASTGDVLSTLVCGTDDGGTTYRMFLDVQWRVAPPPQPWCDICGDDCCDGCVPCSACGPSVQALFGLKSTTTLNSFSCNWSSSSWTLSNGDPLPGSIGISIT